MAMADTSDIREFPNVYLDYDDRDPIFDAATGELKVEIQTPLVESIVKLLTILEKRLTTEVKWEQFSVYTGVSGIALMYMHLAHMKSYFSNITGISISDTTALSYIEKTLPHLEKKHYSFMCGVSGPMAIGALIHHKLGNKIASRDFYQRLENLECYVTVAPQPNISDELLYGRVGFLYSLLLLRKHLGRDEYRDRIIARTVEAIMNSGKHWAKKFKNTLKFPLFFEWHNKAYIGASHGFAGIFHVLLEAREFICNEDLMDLIKPSVDIVLSLQFPSGNFPSSLGKKRDRLIHWCHGAPGVVHLMLEAYKVFNDEKYLKSARQCSEVIWTRGILKKGFGLCHGVAGNGYAHLRMYQVTKEKKYLHRALQFGKWCFDYGSHNVPTPGHPLSLMEGLAGTIYFLIDLLNPEHAAFPAFQV